MALSPRKRARLSNLNIACLALALGILFVHARSHWVSDKFAWPFTTGTFQLQIYRGGLFVLFVEHRRSAGVSPEHWITERADGTYVWPESNVAAWNRQLLLGCGGAVGNEYNAVRLPLWLLFLTAMLYPIWWYQHPHRRRRPQFGICFACGYDLRSSAHRCPECGEPFYTPPPIAPPTSAGAESSARRD